MRKIFVCSPFRGDTEKNVEVAKEYCRYLSRCGCLPFAPHLYFTNFLVDNYSEEREIGISSGLKWLESCDEMHILGDKISEGMKIEILHATKVGVPLVFVHKAGELWMYQDKAPL